MRYANYVDAGVAFLLSILFSPVAFIGWLVSRRRAKP